MPSATDWARLRRESAAGIEPDTKGRDDAEASDAAFARAMRRRRGERGPQVAPTKQAISIRLSRDVLGHFRSSGPGWQARIDAVLRKAARL
ncbi:MAG: BrnA antitoxin family protein [Alphaproteobacteria bacterium]|nr:BrnA antitoxin family protein [Alphaproteobacteria bacterium]